MIMFVRTNAENQEFQDLVRLLDADLAVRNGDSHPFYAQFNKIEYIMYVLVAYEDGVSVGCSAIKGYGPGTMEIKRMYVLPEHRKKGIAAGILSEPERWAKELSCTKFILEAGKKQPEAIALYRMSGYSVIPNYGQYVGVENSVCFVKEIG
jgi:putative acetyltransferase